MYCCHSTLVLSDYEDDLAMLRGIFFCQAEDGIRYLVRSRGLGDVYKRQPLSHYSARLPVPYQALCQPARSPLSPTGSLQF